MIDYSEKAIAIKMEYDCIFLDEFKMIGGRFNSRLWFGAGWIFSRKKHESSLRGMLDYYGLSAIDIKLPDTGAAGDTATKPGAKIPDYFLTDEERKRWARDDYGYKNYPIVVKLTGGELVPISKADLKTEFYFPDEGCDDEIKRAHTAEYMIAENTERHRWMIETLKGVHTDTWRKYAWLANYNKDKHNHWVVDRSNVCPEATNALDVLDRQEYHMAQEGLYKPINDEDKQRLIAGYEYALEQQEKRCRTWLKRYGVEKISVHTYWADR